MLQLDRGQTSRWYQTQRVRYRGENEVSPLGKTCRKPIATGDASASQVTGPVSRWSWYDKILTSRRECDLVLEVRRKFGKICPELRKGQEVRKGSIGRFRKLRGKHTRNPEMGNQPGRPSRARADCSRVRKGTRSWSDAKLSLRP